MNHIKESPIDYSDYTVEELDRELIVRGSQVPEERRFEFGDAPAPPERDTIMRQVRSIYDTAASLSPNEALRHISTDLLVKILLFKTGRIEIDDLKGTWGKDSRKDFYEIEDEKVKNNTGSIAAICSKDNLINLNDDLSILKVKNYGKAFNLDSSELFRQQPISTGRMFTGFLVEDNIVATAGHCADELNVTDLRIIFGFYMEDPSKPAIRVYSDNIYKGVKVLKKVYRSRKGGDGSDWALVKLDRKVTGHKVAELSKKDLTLGQSLYIMGHPCGLPLKYGPGAKVRLIDHTYFAADLDVYCGSSGSPVFDSETHDVVGIVVRGDSRDFRWTGKGWVSIIYPSIDIRSKEPECTKVSELSYYWK